MDIQEGIKIYEKVTTRIVIGDDKIPVNLQEHSQHMYVPKDHPVAILYNKWRESNGEKKIPVNSYGMVELDPDKAELIMAAIKKETH
jgi:hypothetical protein